MGYEIAAGLGVKMAAPDREVYVLVGDGSYLMMAQEIVTSIQEGVRLTILVLDNHGFASIGGLSQVGRLLGVRDASTAAATRRPASSAATCCRWTSPPTRNHSARARSARVLRRQSGRHSKRRATSDRTTAIVIPVDREQRVGGYESWWDVPVAEVSTIDAVQDARAEYERARVAERTFL